MEEALRLARIEEEPIKGVALGKGFHLYEQRNQWVNWDGDTDVVSRSQMAIQLSLNDAEQRAEHFRLQGTKFVIDEIPIVCLRATSGSIIVAELFSEAPFLGYLKHSPLDPQHTMVGRLVWALPPSKWRVVFPAEASVLLTPLDGTFYSRASSPGKGKSHLGWSLKARGINQEGIRKFIADIKALMFNEHDA
ncbi:hypothetical protein B9N43_13230 [Denitratisoma sp. DHT3]|uniref:hypothetical protein n=1 Tax=Denitratisoma sp. DHT3 TaxID=1981880 RepID=UPI001198AD00|nr:hypothetical protein [Denitratisoma sp. DHT3]QDX82121.1 hypothetical protein B9N43_13230 [Denitratisoma sp. DHT3]